MSGEIWSDLTSRPGEDPAAEPEVAPIDERALPRKMRSVAVTGIFVLAIFYTLYFTAEIAIPLVFALLFKLLLQPGVRVLVRASLPHPRAARAVLSLLYGVLVAGGSRLVWPRTVHAAG